jgi:hypothetical protein
MCSHLPRFILKFNDTILSVVPDELVDSETPIVTLLISRFVGLTQSLQGAHKGRMCVRSFIEVSMRACM